MPGLLGDSQFWTDMKSGLLDAANRGAVAGLLGAPVDMVTMALRPLGYSVQKPVGGSEWIGRKMQDAGMVSDRRNPLAEALMGAVSPSGATAFGRAAMSAETALGPKAAEMTQTAIESYMARNGLTQYAALHKPLGTGPHYAVESLAEYTPKLYRETSIDRATEFLPNSMSNPQTLWFSNEPAYALGQGPNRGVMLEFNAQGVPGQLSLQKPMARQAYESGNAEFVSQDAIPSQIGSHLQSIRVDNAQQSGPYFRRIQGLLKDWKTTKEADGAVVFRRPE